MITAVVLSHNNETFIKRCLESLKWCDEIVVIDDDSTDKTQHLARSSGARVIQHSLRNNFAAQRNLGLKEANGEWVLFVDSDEIIPLKLANEIQDAIKTTDIHGFYLKRTDVIFNTQLQFGETANVRLLRLGRKDAGKWIRSVHEVWEIKGPTTVLDHHILHYPHQTMTEFIDDINTYSTLHAEEFYKQGKRISAWEIVAYPAGKFLQNYILRQGFRDGTAGAIVAMMMSFHSFLAKGKLYLMYTRGVKA